MKKEIPTITVSELLDNLKGLPLNAEISFSGLDFYRVKKRAVNVYQIEFNQMVYLNDEGLVAVDNLE